MKLRNPRLISAASWILTRLIRGWIGTLRVQIPPNVDHVDPRVRASCGQYIYAFWHETLLLPAQFFHRHRVDCRVLISRHADGQLIAETAERLGYKTVRGSSSRGAVEALHELLEPSTSHIAITPDGPRGPRRTVQQGAVYLASRTGLPIVAVGIAFDRPWRAKSWDRFAVPRPFSRAVFTMRGPIAVPQDIGRKELARYRQIFQTAMDEATDEAEAQIEGRVPLAAAA